MPSYRCLVVLCICCLAVSLTACAPFAPDAREGALAFSSHYEGKTGEEQSAFARGGGDSWWKSFNNTELNTLVDSALGENFDVLTARARLMQLEASARKSGAELWPALTGSTGADHARRSTMADRQSSRVETTGDSLSLGGAVSYELDLWGRVRSTREADVLRATASREDVRTATMTVAASVADTWVQLVTAREDIRLIERQIETNRILLESLSLRFANALGTGLDVLQQQEVYAASLAELPLAQAAESAQRTRLAILLGRNPGTEPVVQATALPVLPPMAATGIPADLLEQRPDIRAAWMRLSAADWAVSAAQADRLPKITLSADASYGGQRDVLFSNWIANLSAGLVAPLFDGGRRTAEVDRMRGLAEEGVQTYAKTVATAVGEVQDAISYEARQKEYLSRLGDQLRFATIVRNEARQGYLNGRDDFLRFISEHKNVQGLERKMLQQAAVLVRYRIELHRALGGMI